MPNLTEFTATFFQSLMSILDVFPVAPDTLFRKRRRRGFRRRMATVSGHRCLPRHRNHRPVPALQP